MLAEPSLSCCPKTGRTWCEGARITRIAASKQEGSGHPVVRRRGAAAGRREQRGSAKVREDSDVVPRAEHERSSGASRSSPLLTVRCAGHQAVQSNAERRQSEPDFPASRRWQIWRGGPSLAHLSDFQLWVATSIAQLDRPLKRIRLGSDSIRTACSICICRDGDRFYARDAVALGRI